MLTYKNTTSSELKKKSEENNDARKTDSHFATSGINY